MGEGRENRKGWSWKPPLAKLARFFVHGIAFSVSLAIFYFAWIFIAAFLIVAGIEIALLLGLVIGLLLAFALFILVEGALNVLITELVWGIDLKHNLKSILSHAFVLFVALVGVGIPSLIIRYIVPGLPTTIVLTICYCFIDGFVCKSVASNWIAERTAYESEWFSILKYPLLFGLIIADITIVIPAFVISLATTLWWAGLIAFCVLQSPLAFLAIEETRNTNPAGHSKDGWWTPNQPQELNKVVQTENLATGGIPLAIEETRNANPTIKPKDGWWTPNQPQELGRLVLTKLSSTELLARFFLHGLALSALLMISISYVSTFYAWTFLTFPANSVLTPVMAIASLIVGIGLFFLVIGGMNVILTQAIWHVSIRQDLRNILGHGFLLLALLVIVGIPNIFLFFMTSTMGPAYFLNILLTIFFISYCFVDGLVASWIALYWAKGRVN